MSNLVMEEQRGALYLFGRMRGGGAVADLDPALDLGLELHGLGLGGARRAQHKGCDLAVQGVLLEQERELAALVDLDGMLEFARGQLGLAKAVDALERPASGKVENVGLVEQGPLHRGEKQADLGDERREHAGIEGHVAPTIGVHGNLAAVVPRGIEACRVDDAGLVAGRAHVGQGHLDGLGEVERDEALDQHAHDRVEIRGVAWAAPKEREHEEPTGHGAHVVDEVALAKRGRAAQFAQVRVAVFVFFAQIMPGGLPGLGETRRRCGPLGHACIAQGALDAFGVGRRGRALHQEARGHGLEEHLERQQAADEIALLQFVVVTLGEPGDHAGGLDALGGVDLFQEVEGLAARLHGQGTHLVGQERPHQERFASLGRAKEPNGLRPIPGAPELLCAQRQALQRHGLAAAVSAFAAHGGL
jgi:hypothetical protein